ncbi:MAG: thiamine diphosphokinase [Acidimicrobiales bacterium]
MTESIVVIGGGEAPKPSIADRLPPASFVIAADSGVDHARRLGLRPDVVVGDLDSASAEGLAWAQDVGADIVRHPTDKDATDLELALDIAQERASVSAASGAGPVAVWIVDGGGGRLDHLVGNLVLLAAPRPHMVLTGLVGSAVVTPVHVERQLRGAPGEVISLVAFGGPATGVTTKGLRWSLEDAVLEPFTSLGVSNEFAAEDAVIGVAGGTILAIQPGSRRL